MPTSLGPARATIGAAAILAAVLSCSPVSADRSQPAGPPPEVRQIVTFLFQPGRLAEAQDIYEKQLLPIYADVKPLLRLRAYREAESPEPLDLVIVSSYAGMAGMDAGNEALRLPHRSGQSAFRLYGELSRMTVTHHDQFVEMIAGLSDPSDRRDGLTVFEYLRVAPGAQDTFERLLAGRVREFEQQRALYQWSETGRMLVADGWDYLRVFGVGSLDQWHAAQTAMRQSPFQRELAPLVAVRKTLILRHDSRLAVR
jgi:hypothetical protein